MTRASDIIFPKRLGADSSLHHILESENVRFAFSKKKWCSLGSKIWKIKFQKIICGEFISKISFENCTFSRKFLTVLKPKENSRKYLRLGTDISMCNQMVTSEIRE